jgi:hypothetical protein
VEYGFPNIVILGVEVLKAVRDEPGMRDIIKWRQLVQGKG